MNATTSKFEAQATRIVITKKPIHSAMAKSNTPIDIEDGQKTEPAVVERLAKLIEDLPDIEK